MATVKDDPIKRVRDLVKDDLDLMDKKIAEYTFSEESLIPKMSEYIISSGGKRLRPILTIISAKLFGYKGSRHINLAAAVEFIHTATLLHDDVVDESKMRRGKATSNDMWGNKASILVGDFLFSQSFKLMAADGDEHVLGVLSSASAIIAEGEVMQLVAYSDLQKSKEEYIKIISAKTAALFAAACQIGAAVSKVSLKEELALRSFGQNLGIAFQIMDDALDYSAEEQKLGKNLGDDFREGKVTLPIILAYEQANEEERNLLKRTMCDHIQESGDLELVVKILNKYNIIDGVFKVACEYAEEAREAISNFEDSQIKSIMLDILEFSIKRAY